jgi:hypothetical protein
MRGASASTSRVRTTRPWNPSTFIRWPTGESAVKHRGGEVHESDLRALARDKEGLPIRGVIWHGRGSGGEVGDERDPIRDPPAVLDLGDLRGRGQQILLPQDRQLGASANRSLAGVMSSGRAIGPEPEDALAGGR